MHKTISHFVDIFEKQELEYLIKDCDESLDKAITNDFWEDNVKQYSTDVMTFNIKPGSKSFDIIKDKCISLFNSTPYSMSYYYWKEGGYIPWHDDGKHQAAFTAYLNSDWKIEYGGLFQYSIIGPVKTIFPFQNTGVYQYGGVGHSTTIQAKGSPIRKSIQCFFKNI